MQTSAMKGASLRGAPFRASGTSRKSALLVECNKRVQKKTKVILTADLTGVGKEGDIKSVPTGYWRNFLLPTRRAEIASEDILSAIRKTKEDEIRKKMEIKAQAQSFANALSTIGKFMIKKKTGEKDQIYGSVQVSEVVDAIYQQTGQNLSDKEITIPEIKAAGQYECTVVLHPEVTATFNVVVLKDKSLTIKTNEPAKKKK